MHPAFAPLPDVAAFLRGRLRDPLPGPAAQRLMAPRPPHRGWRPDDRPAGARDASALILLYPGTTGEVLLPLTLRHADLPHHGGQVSLPGGRLDPGETAADAALREAEEELGIPRSHVQLLGSLSSFWVIVSNHVIFPFVGLADTRPAFRPAAREVAELIEAPLAGFFDPRRIGWGGRLRGGVPVDFPYFDVDGHQVWGATAMILGEFAALFDPSFAPPDLPESRG